MTLMNASSRHDKPFVATSQAEFDGVDLQALASRLGTPLYAYSANAIAIASTG